jgi:hypothetical protein
VSNVHQKSTGKFLRVAENAAEKLNADEATIEVWEKDPSIHAFTDLMNRAIDKPVEPVEMAVLGELAGDGDAGWRRPARRRLARESLATAFAPPEVKKWRHALSAFGIGAYIVPFFYFLAGKGTSGRGPRQRPKGRISVLLLVAMIVCAACKEARSIYALIALASYMSRARSRRLFSSIARQFKLIRSSPQHTAD